VRVIVMLTAESESGMIKCHAYWTATEYGPVRIKLLSEKTVCLDVDTHRSDPNASSSHAEPTGRRRANTAASQLGGSTSPAPSDLGASVSASVSATATATAVDAESQHHVVIRKFSVSHAAHPSSPIREVTHLHYISWPDFGAPARSSHLLALVELSNIMQRANPPVEMASVAGGSSISSLPDTAKAALSIHASWNEGPETDSRPSPMLVHCSAGCGRTGTFCAIDSVIDMLKRQLQITSTMSRSRAVTTSTDRDAQGDVYMTDGNVVPESSRVPDANLATSAHAPVSSPTTAFHPLTSDITGSAVLGTGLTPPPLDTSWLDNDSTDLVEEVVQDFRRQRMSMVQSLRQYVLCYEAVLEWMWRTHDRAASYVAGGGVRPKRMRTSSMGE